MSIKGIKVLADSLSQDILNNMISDFFMEVSYDSNGSVIGDFERAFNHVGIYGFILKKECERGVVYIGKTENDNRLRQHITGKNKDGTPLKESVSTKHEEIRKAIHDGYQVCLSLYSSDDFNKASLSCIEISCIQKGIVQLASVFPNKKTWNKRI